MQSPGNVSINTGVTNNPFSVYATDGVTPLFSTSTSGTVAYTDLNSTGSITATNNLAAKGLIIGGNKALAINSSTVAAYGGITLSSITGNTAVSSVSGQVTLNGTYVLANNQVVMTSDRRLKTAIEPIHEAEEKMDRLSGVQFKWIRDGKPDIGLIAQEVEKVFPELVKTDDQGMKAVAYSNLVAPLLEAYKAAKTRLQGEIDHLRHDLDAQTAENQKLHERLDRLEKSVADLKKSSGK